MILISYILLQLPSGAEALAKAVDLSMHSSHGFVVEDKVRLSHLEVCLGVWEGGDNNWELCGGVVGRLIMMDSGLSLVKLVKEDVGLLFSRC